MRSTPQVFEVVESPIHNRNGGGVKGVQIYTSEGIHLIFTPEQVRRGEHRRIVDLMREYAALKGVEFKHNKGGYNLRQIQRLVQTTELP